MMKKYWKCNLAKKFVRITSGFGGGEFTKTLRKVCTCQKLKFSFLLLEYCKIRECYAVANASTYWKFNLNLCQEQLRNVRVSQFSSCFSWNDWFCESYTSYTTINYTLIGMELTLQDLKLGGNLEFSWYSCNILRYCSNRCIVWFSIPANCPAQANRKFPVQLLNYLPFGNLAVKNRHLFLC
jgi:hypothetical protein